MARTALQEARREIQTLRWRLEADRKLRKRMRVTYENIIGRKDRYIAELRREARRG